MKQVFLVWKGDGYGHKEVVSAHATEPLAEDALKRGEGDWQECRLVEEGPILSSTALPPHTVITSTRTLPIEQPKEVAHD